MSVRFHLPNFVDRFNGSMNMTLISMIDCQVKCNKINEKIYKALRGEYENQGVYGDDY